MTEPSFQLWSTTRPGRWANHVEVSGASPIKKVHEHGALAAQGA